jgi:hypothetical protein
MRIKSVNRPKENRARERRIEVEVVVDAYNAVERAMSWYYYLEERLEFPFKARCKSKREISPLRIGKEVEVVGMAAEEECESEMFVRLKWDGRRMAVPLSQLEPLAVDTSTNEAVADWHYWVGRGYEF